MVITVLASYDCFWDVILAHILPKFLCEGARALRQHAMERRILEPQTRASSLGPTAVGGHWGPQPVRQVRPRAVGQKRMKNLSNNALHNFTMLPYTHASLKFVSFNRFGAGTAASGLGPV